MIPTMCQLMVCSDQSRNTSFNINTSVQMIFYAPALEPWECPSPSLKWTAVGSLKNFISRPNFASEGPDKGVTWFVYDVGGARSQVGE